MFDNVVNAFYQMVRLAQIVLIPSFACLFTLGFIFLLTAGKNPIRKRRGMMFIIGFGLATFLIAYAPSIVHSLTGETPIQTANGKSVEELVDATTPIGSIIFNGLLYAAIPITGTMFYFGVFIRILAGKNPGRKRLGLGLTMFSPIVFLVVLIIPILLPKL